MRMIIIIFIVASHFRHIFLITFALLIILEAEFTLSGTEATIFQPQEYPDKKHSVAWTGNELIYKNFPENKIDKSSTTIVAPYTYSKDSKDTLELSITHKENLENSQPANSFSCQIPRYEHSVIFALLRNIGNHTNEYFYTEQSSSKNPNQHANEITEYVKNLVNLIENKKKNIPNHLTGIYAIEQW